MFVYVPALSLLQTHISRYVTAAVVIHTIQ